MEYTLTTAAETTGLSRSTIHRAIQKGRLSAHKLEDGTLRIDGAELARVYPPVPRETTGPSPWAAPGRPKTGSDGSDTELAVLRVEVRMLADQLARGDRERETLNETVGDLRRRLDKSEDRVLALTAIPAAPPETSVEATSVAPAVAEPSRPSRGLLAWLLGR